VVIGSGRALDGLAGPVVVPVGGAPRRIWSVYPPGRTKSMARCIANSRVDGPLHWLADGGADPVERGAGAWGPPPGRLVRPEGSGPLTPTVASATTCQLRALINCRLALPFLLNQTGYS